MPNTWLCRIWASFKVCRSFKINLISFNSNQNFCGYIFSVWCSIAQPSERSSIGSKIVEISLKHKTVTQNRSQVTKYYKTVLNSDNISHLMDMNEYMLFSKWDVPFVLINNDWNKLVQIPKSFYFFANLSQG